MNRLGITTAAAAAVATALALTSCTPAPPEISALLREATPADHLPEDVAMGELTQEELEGVRLLATHRGIRYFVGQSDDKTTTCIAILPDGQPSSWLAGCGQAINSQQEILRADMPGIVSVVLVPDNYDTSGLRQSGMQQIQENIVIGRTPTPIPSL